MLLLPLANSGGVVRVSEIVLVPRLIQPGLLALSPAGLATLGLGTEALARAIPVIRKKMFHAVEAFAAALRSLHGFPKPKEPVSEQSEEAGKKISCEEKPKPRRRKKTVQSISGRKRSEQDPFSNCPFCATFTSPLISPGCHTRIVDSGL